MSFQLHIEGRFVGEFHSPLELIGNVQFFCRYCGVVFATRVSSRDEALWDYWSGACLMCARSRRVRPWQGFRAEGEEALEWEPPALLAEEFLFNSRGLENGSSSSSSGLATGT